MSLGKDVAIPKVLDQQADVGNRAISNASITKIESLRFLSRGLSSTLLFDFSNFGSGYQRLCLAEVPDAELGRVLIKQAQLNR
jgi:hypothetical protein